MRLDRPVTDIEPLGDRERGLAVDSQAHYLALASGEGLGANAKCRSPWPALGAGQEELHLLEDRFGFTDPRHVVNSRQLDQLGFGDPLGQVPAVADVEPLLFGPVQDQSWYLNSGEDVPDIDLRVHLDQGLRHAWARSRPKVTGPPLPVALIREGRGVVLNPPLAGLPGAIDAREKVLELFPGPAPGIVLIHEPPGIRAVRDESRSPLGIRGGENDRQRAAFRYAKQGGALGSHGVEDGSNIVHPLGK